MSEILLAKQKLPDGWIDAAVGESHIVREALFRHFPGINSNIINLFTDNKSCYPEPQGWTPLVKLLEDKYQAPIVITNGAKQALGAAFYALNKMGKTKLGLRCPWWCLIPPLAKVHGLECITNERNIYDNSYNAYLAILPNNPCGYMQTYGNAKHISDYHKGVGIPYIVDSAYYTHTYLSKDYPLLPLGDLQIYSLSKSHGLSGLRIGFIVCHNKDYYNTLLEYMETMTVGVSIPSQDICHNILKEVWENKERESQFIDDTRDKLYIAKALCKTIDKRVVEVPDDITEVSSMFGWFKCNDMSIFTKAKVSVIGGEPFGAPGYVRMNLALPTNVIVDAIERLNRVANEI